MKLYRARLLWFDPAVPGAAGARLEEDGLLVTTPGSQGVAVVQAVGPYHALIHQYPGVPVHDWGRRLIAPGFVDLHVHYPQVDVIAAPADGLLPWLEQHTFPQEARFADPKHAAAVADFFLDELQRNGVTTALCFATSHPASVDALFAAAQARSLRLITGLCLMDRNAPESVRNRASAPGLHDAAEHSIDQSEALLQRWHGLDRLGYAITPRFAPACSDVQLRLAGELAARHPSAWIQSHVAENRDEIAWARVLFPSSRSYLGTYDDFGLLRERAVYAHCIHLDAQDRELLTQSGAAAAVCPTSNLFLGSGFFDYAAARASGMRLGLASDVGGGTSFCPLHTMSAAFCVAREGQSKRGLTLSARDLWWQHTQGAAVALGLEGVVGNLAPGCEADFVVLDPEATPLLARRTAQARNLDEWLFAFIVLGDDRAVVHCQVAGAA